MARVLMAFFVGLTAGFLGLYVACIFVRSWAYEYIDPLAFKHRSPTEYATLVDNRTATGLLQISLYGGILCGALCAVKVAGKPEPKTERRKVKRTTVLTHEQPLSATE